MTNLLLARLAASEAEAVAGSGEQQGASAADAAAPPGAYTAACPTPARAGLRKRRRGEGAASTATSAGLVGYFGEVGGEERGTGVAVQDVDGEGKDKDTAQVAGRRRCRDVAGRSLRDFVAPADLCRSGTLCSRAAEARRTILANLVSCRSVLNRLLACAVAHVSSSGSSPSSATCCGTATRLSTSACPFASARRALVSGQLVCRHSDAAALAPSSSLDVCSQRYSTGKDTVEAGDAWGV